MVGIMGAVRHGARAEAESLYSDSQAQSQVREGQKSFTGNNLGFKKSQSPPPPSDTPLNKANKTS